MKRAVLIAGAVVALAVVVRWAARSLPPTGTSGPPEESRAPASREALAKLAELGEILASKNDNDPRLDHDFNALTAEDKGLFREEYERIPAEKRNERGTIVFLLGRNLAAPEDWAFMKAVALEPPCLSLSDCAKKPGPAGSEEAAGDEVTLAYPSLVALKQAEFALKRSPANIEALSVIVAAKSSKTRAVSRLAAVLERRFAASSR